MQAQAKMYRKPTYKHPNSKALLVCLDKISEGYQEESEDSYLDYTKRWIRAVDRVGLFRINYEVYVLFYEIEKKVRQFLVKLIGQSSQLDKKEIVEEIVTHENIQFFWSMISVDIDQHVGEQLLTQIVQLWLTIHGFSTAGAFVEQYKQVTTSHSSKYVMKSSSSHYHYKNI